MSLLIDHLVQERSKLSRDEMAILQYLEDYGNSTLARLKGKAKDPAAAIKSLLAKKYVWQRGSTYGISSAGFDQLPG